MTIRDFQFDPTVTIVYGVGYRKCPHTRHVSYSLHAYLALPLKEMMGVICLGHVAQSVTSIGKALFYCVIVGI